MAAAPSLSTQSVSAQPSSTAIIACMLAGMCTFLNVYLTQPLLPFLRRVYHTTPIGISLTVSATILAVALTAPFVGIMAESIGRKKVIVPSLYLLTIPTVLAATSQTLPALICWRFLQGVFVPGIIVVMIAYINEEFPPSYVGRAMASYITGTVLGGFLGRFISGLVAHHLDWRASFLAVGALNLGGAIIVQRALPKARNFVRASSWQDAMVEFATHLRNVRLLAVFGMGFSALFCLVGVFTYANFYLADPPFHLNSQQLGSVFFVYLLGLLVTPLSGRCLDRYGVRRTAVLAFAFSLAGLLLTLVANLGLIITGLAFLSSGIFVFQAVGTVQTGLVARRAHSSAAGLYVTFYYVGGSLGAIVTGWTWLAGGWRACVLLLIGVAAITLGLAYAASETTVAEA